MIYRAAVKSIVSAIIEFLSLENAHIISMEDKLVWDVSKFLKVAHLQQLFIGTSKSILRSSFFLVAAKPKRAKK